MIGAFAVLHIVGMCDASQIIVQFLDALRLRLHTRSSTVTAAACIDTCLPWMYCE